MTDKQEAAAATRVRLAWMRLIGLEGDEIALHHRECPATSLDDELDQLDAAVKIGGLPEQPTENPPIGTACRSPTT